MRYDARTLPAHSVIDAHLCIVGAGPAGLSLASEFLGSDVHVVLLESGGIDVNGVYQELNDGAVIGDAYHRLQQTRHRQIGGTAHLWNSPLPNGDMGAKYAPLDPWDFEKQEDEARSDGWPFAYADLEPFYVRAQRVCGLGVFRYAADYWIDAAGSALSLSGFFTSNVYQFGAADMFLHTHGDRIAGSTNIDLYHDLTTCGLETDNRDATVTAAVAACANGRSVHVRADVFVLAAGAVENARLLLLSSLNRPRALGDHSGWLGRGLMEHPRDSALTLTPRAPTFFEDARFYDAHVTRDGTVVCGRIGVRHSALREARLPNVSITLLPLAAPLLHGRIARALPQPLRRFAEWAAERRPTAPAYGWSRRLASGCDFRTCRLYMNLEQWPHRDNRILLSSKRDWLGMPRVEMRWRFQKEMSAAVDRLRAAIASQIERCGLGRVTVDQATPIDPNAHHHAGTTRMHRDAGLGVVDPDLRVHETTNLYVAGASVFPSAGFANPTLTIVALSLRLADHLRANWFRRPAS